MRRAVLDQDGNVVNVVVADDTWTPPDGLTVVADETAEIGGQIVGGVYTPPQAPPPSPSPLSPITDWQFAQELVDRQIITQEQAEAFVGAGVVPSPLIALIESLPADLQPRVRILIMGATTYHRSHATTVAIGQAFGYDDDALDQFFRDAAQH
jgi:hypothetical protein